jgi:hypothetical protein
MKGKRIEENADNSDVEASDGEGSVYDKSSKNSKQKPNDNEQRTTNVASAKTSKSNKKQELSGLILPQTGNKLLLRKLSEN